MSISRPSQTTAGGTNMLWLRMMLIAAVTAFGLALPGVAQAAPAATLAAPASGMVNVPVTFTVAVQPPPVNAIAQVQVATSSGWVKIEQAAIDAKGRAKGTLASSVTGNRSYRAAIISRANGKVLTYSKPISITWAPLTHTATLACAQSTAPVRVDVACTITVTPTARLAGLAAQLQVMGRTDWVAIDTWSIPSTGVISTSVEGYDPGLGRYRVRLLRAGVEVALSNTVTISWT